MVEERRSSHRYKLWLPARIENGKDTQLAVGHDISEGGALLVTNHQPEVGSELNLSLTLPPKNRVAATVRATVLRCSRNSSDPDGLWPFQIAVQFHDLEPMVLEKLQEHKHLLISHGHKAKQT